MSLKTPALLLVSTENILKTELFKNDDVMTIADVISLSEFSSNTNPKWPVIVALSPALVWAGPLTQLHPSALINVT